MNTGMRSLRRWRISLRGILHGIRDNWLQTNPLILAISKGISKRLSTFISKRLINCSLPTMSSILNSKLPLKRKISLPMQLLLFKKTKKIQVMRKKSAIADVQVKYSVNIFVQCKSVKNHMGLKAPFSNIWSSNTPKLNTFHKVRQSQKWVKMKNLQS